jgi:hypothetical protein
MIDDVRMGLIWSQVETGDSDIEERIFRDWIQNLIKV